MLKVTFFGTTTLLFDDGKDQLLFDAHLTRPSARQFFGGEKASTNTALCDSVVFFRVANYCEEHNINFLIRYPCTSIEI